MDEVAGRLVHERQLRVHDAQVVQASREGLQLVEAVEQLLLDGADVEREVRRREDAQLDNLANRFQRTESFAGVDVAVGEGDAQLFEDGLLARLAGEHAGVVERLALTLLSDAAQRNAAVAGELADERRRRHRAVAAGRDFPLLVPRFRSAWAVADEVGEW